MYVIRLNKTVVVTLLESLSPLLALKKEATMLWYAYGKGHVAGTWM